MKRLIYLAYFFICSYLNAEGALSNLIEYDKATCLEQLQKASKEELWDVFLDGQAKLFFDSEIEWIAKQDWWKQAINVLEIGSGNGAYLSKLAEKFPKKSFHGIEKLPLSVTQSNERYAKNGLEFEEGDAEVFDNNLTHSSDIVLFRLTLQHLEKPIDALNHAWHYLSSDGHVLIIDACDSAKKNSHPLPEVDKVLKLIADSQKKSGTGNRKITLELLRMLDSQNSILSELYDVTFSNLDINGHVQHEIICLKGEKNRNLFFNHGLLGLSLMSKIYQIPVELSQAYDELKVYLEEENAWSMPGIHLLVLKRKSLI